MKTIAKYAFISFIVAFVAGYAVNAYSKESLETKKIDKDGNGVISFEEFSSVQQRTFNKMDKDSNGYLSRNELDRKFDKEKGLSRYADKLDLNDDLKIDKQEFIRGQGVRKPSRDHNNRGPKPKGRDQDRQAVSAKIFDALDKDKNGNLSTSELSKAREIAPGVAKDHKFNQFDSDGNKKLSKEEFLKPTKNRFSSMDKNNDQTLDRTEIRRNVNKHPNSKRNNKYSHDRKRADIKKRVDRFEMGLKRKLESGEITQDDANQLRKEMKKKMSEMRKQRSREGKPPYKNK